MEYLITPLTNPAPNRSADLTAHVRTRATVEHWGSLRADGSALDQQGGLWCTCHQRSVTSFWHVMFCTTLCKITACHLMIWCSQRNACPCPVQPHLRALERRQDIINRFWNVRYELLIVWQVGYSLQEMNSAQHVVHLFIFNVFIDLA